MTGRVPSPMIFPPAVGTYVLPPTDTHVYVPGPQGSLIRKRRPLGRVFDWFRDTVQEARDA